MVRLSHVHIAEKRVMSDTAITHREPFLRLPGFMPDALPFAARSALSLMLAYWIAFTAQVDSASSAGVCVAIIAQPSSGMARSKAGWRIVGTVVGGFAALGLLSAFPQDRTMLLAGFAVWLGLCTFFATLLRDFRSYAAALAGYTVGIIAIGVITAPQTALAATLNRVAAIVMGIVCVMVVNTAFGATTAFDALVVELRDRTDKMTALVLDALEGRKLQDDMAMVTIAAGAAALRTQGTYAAHEFPDGRRRRNGALHTIAALLAMVAASRTGAALLGPDTAEAVRAHLKAVASALRDPGSPVPSAPIPTTPNEALLLERADQLLTMHRDALAGLHALTGDFGELPRIRLATSYDVPAAFIGATRAIIGTAIGGVFSVIAGWPGATLWLIQYAALIALLGIQPNPSAASVAFGVPLLPVAVITGVVDYLLLPHASGYAMFTLAIAPAAFVAALTVRQATLAPYSTATFLYVPLLLSPSNTESFDFGGYCNTVLEVAGAATLTYLSFGLILKVSPRRRLYRVAAQTAKDLRRTIHERGRLLDQPRAQGVLYDRMSRALTWLGPPTQSRRRLLSHIYGMGEIDLAFRRARTGLADARDAEPLLRDATDAASDALEQADAATLLQAAQTLLDHPAAAHAADAVRRAVSGMAGIARVIGADAPALRFYRRLIA